MGTLSNYRVQAFYAVPVLRDIARSARLDIALGSSDQLGRLLTPDEIATLRRVARLAAQAASELEDRPRKGRGKR